MSHAQRLLWTRPAVEVLDHIRHEMARTPEPMPAVDPWPWAWPGTPWNSPTRPHRVYERKEQ